MVTKALVLGLLLATQLSCFAAVLDPGVDGYNVVLAKCSFDRTFKRTDEKRWVEVVAGVEKHTFEEYKRDKWSVYLKGVDVKDKRIRLDLYDKKVYYRAKPSDPETEFLDVLAVTGVEVDGYNAMMVICSSGRVFKRESARDWDWHEFTDNPGEKRYWREYKRDKWTVYLKPPRYPYYTNPSRKQLNLWKKKVFYTRDPEKYPLTTFDYVASMSL